MLHSMNATASTTPVKYHIGPSALSRDEAFILMARLRREYQLYAAATAAQDGYRTAAIAVLAIIECTANPDELWTYCPSTEAELWTYCPSTEAELQGNTRLGDHLALTRHTLGLNA